VAGLISARNETKRVERHARWNDFMTDCALPDLDLLECPTKFIGADPAMPHACLPALDPRLASAMNYDFIPETTHLRQLEEPEECAALTREFLEPHGLA